MAARIGAFRQMKVSLKWLSAVDLDLMAFYRTVDGRVGGVFSANYAGGSMGDLNAFPFMQLSDDAGVGASAGENQEDMLIADLDQLQELWICAINFTDALSEAENFFADYGAQVEVVTDSGEQHVFPLDSEEAGCCAVLCKFVAGEEGAELSAANAVMDLARFQAEAPGAAALDLASKGGGGEVRIGAFTQMKVSLCWTAAVDLDLMAFYRAKDGRTGGVYSDHYSGGNMGELNAFPFMQLSEDAGLDAKGGDFQEDMLVASLDDLEELWICAVNYTDAKAERTRSFASFGPRVELLTDTGESHSMELACQDEGAFAVLCRFQAGEEGAQVMGADQVMDYARFKTEVPGAQGLDLFSKRDPAAPPAPTMPLPRPGQDPAPAPEPGVEGKPWIVTLLLWFILGPFGVHRFFTGHIGLGVLQLCTGGLCMLFWLYDGYLLLTGEYRDADGNELQK